MAPTNPGGRPKLDWTSSRKRKLGRLYLLTDIAIPDIQQILKDEKFNPSVRSIQAQLSLLLPNNVKEWRQYRPTERTQMVNRLAQLKRARKDRISKYTSSRSHTPLSIVPSYKPIKNEHATYSQLPSPHYDPSRYYSGEPSTGSPHQFTLTSYSLLEKNHHPDIADVLNDSLSSCNAATSSGEEDNFSSPSSAFTMNSPADSDTLPSLNPDEVKRASEPPIPSASSPPERSDTSTTTNARTAMNAQIQVLTRNGDQLKSISSLVTRRTVESIRRIPRSISSKMSHCLSHIESVISTTNSWRSSLIDAMSLSSDVRSDKSCEVPFTREEYRTWDELVDESKFTSNSQTHTENDAISLKSRPCCVFFENDVEKRVLCKVCGFSEAHALARNSWSDDSSVINCAAVDRFGNTPLHHAAAAGNLKRVMQLMDLSLDIHSRNTSGETFLHVLELEDIDRGDLDEVLRKAVHLLFDFALKDHQGNIVVTRYQDLAHFIWNEQYVQWIFSHINDSLDGNELNKEQSKPSIALWKRRTESEKAGCDDLDVNGDTEIIARLRKWPVEPLSDSELDIIIKRSNVHMRARRGYTAIAIAVRHGVRSAISLLLENGANPNNRSYRKTSIMAFAAACLAKAQKDQDSGLYARILSCIVLLADHGGKADPTVYDEFTIRSMTLKRKKAAPLIDVTKTTKEVYRHPCATVENAHHGSNKSDTEIEIDAALRHQHYYQGHILPKMQIISELEPQIWKKKRTARILRKKPPP